VELGDRLVPFEAIFNFRDVGGYETVAGHRVRSGVVFRSGPLHRLTPGDLHRVSELGVRTVIDLRSTGEIAEWGRFPPTAGVTFHHLPFSARGTLAAVLRTIAEDDEAIVFHCGSGKDRTGVVTALLLSTLGVPDHVIGADYQLSELALAPSIAWAEANDTAMAAAITSLPAWKRQSSPDTMRLFLDLLREQHGSVAGYLEDAGVEPTVVDALRARLLV
jgi:protein-tyrosine phosphatase